jgi:hypothetical protein
VNFNGLIRIKYFEKIYFDPEKWIFTGIFPLLLIKTGSQNIYQNVLLMAIRRGFTAFWNSVIVDPPWFLSLGPLCSLGFRGNKEAPKRTQRGETGEKLTSLLSLSQNFGAV